MNSYFIAIKTAFIIFPFIAILITFPYMIIQYRKYGSISRLRTVILYSFILYLLCMYLLIILPLPTIEEVMQLTGTRVQLRPFQFIRDFLRETKLVITNPATWIPALTQSCFLQVVFNILLFVPFGVYMRYYFGCNWKKVFLIAFSVSLFFELTQLSGLYGIYPRGYRLFDVDDLFLNTSGAMAGFLIEPIFVFFLPSRKTLDERAYQNGRRVSFTRRMLAFFIDCFLFGIVTILGTWIIGGFSYILVLYLTGGYTPGMKLLKIQVTNEEGNAPAFVPCVIRNGILYYGFFVFPLVLLGVLVIDGIVEKRGEGTTLFYERISKTRCVSLIQPKRTTVTKMKKI